MLSVLRGLLSFLGGLASRLTLNATVRFVALKYLLIALFTLTLPAVLYNVFSHLLSDFLNFVNSRLQAVDVVSPSIRLVGCAGWLAVHLRILESFSIIFSAFLTRLAISFIPFLGRV